MCRHQSDDNGLWKLVHHSLLKPKGYFHFDCVIYVNLPGKLMLDQPGFQFANRRLLFLVRTLETAAAIAHELSISEININYRIFEWLKMDFFPEGCPVDNIIFTQLESQEQE